IGQLSNWRLPFCLTALLGVIVFFMSTIILPRNLHRNKSSIMEQLLLFTHSKIILAFAIPVFTFAGTYVIYTHITPIIEEGLSVPSIFVSIILFVYGFFFIVCKYLYGELVDNN